MARIDWGAVGTGAALSLFVLALTIALVEVADRTVGVGHGSNWIFLFYAMAFGGLAAGGWLAARRRPDAALVHGVLAALAAYAVVMALDVVVGLAVDSEPDPVALAFNALMAASAGTLGTLVAERGSGRTPEPDPSPTP